MFGGGGKEMEDIGFGDGVVEVERRLRVGDRGKHMIVCICR